MTTTEDSIRSDSDQIKLITKELETWLDAPNWSAVELRYWLKGYKFFPYGDDPYVWILRSLPEDSNYRTAMGNRLAEFLRVEQPYKSAKKNEEDDAVLFYNLFCLAAGLGTRGKLGAELLQAFGFFTENRIERANFFDETKWYNLSAAFREALITNQPNACLMQRWRDGLVDQSETFLPGDIYSYFRGLLYLPRTPTEPDFDGIGWGLRHMAEYLKGETRRQEKFRRLLERVKEVWTQVDTWDEILLRRAVSNCWPDWAVVRLDKLIIALDEHSSFGRGYLLWDFYIPFLKEWDLPFRVEKTYNVVCKVVLSPAAEEFLSRHAERVDKVRLRTAARSYTSVFLIANEVFNTSDIKSEMAKARVHHIVRRRVSPEREEKVEKALLAYA